MEEKKQDFTARCSIGEAFQYISNNPESLTVLGLKPLWHCGIWPSFFRTWRPRLAKIHHELLLFHRSIQPGTSPRFQELKPRCILMHQREGLTGSLQSNFSQYINSFRKKETLDLFRNAGYTLKIFMLMGKMVINDNALVILG